MHIIINVSKGMELNLSPLVFPMNFDFKTPEKVSIKIKNTMPEFRLIENRMTGVLFTENKDPGTLFKISDLDDDGEYLNITCSLKQGRM